ncbi:hypothetical protein BKA56DRAFT_496946, partial [Ilyonectria sp. MPI-CAGE-AT-0026]
PTPHNHARYVLSGPEDVTGKRIVEPVEEYTGVKVERAEFKVTSWLEDLVEAGVYPEKLPSILAGFEPLWQGKCTLAGTLKELMELAAPSSTPTDALKDMVEV